LNDTTVATLKGKVEENLIRQFILSKDKTKYVMKKERKKNYKKKTFTPKRIHITNNVMPIESKNTSV